MSIYVIPLLATANLLLKILTSPVKWNGAACKNGDSWSKSSGESVINSLRNFWFWNFERIYSLIRLKSPKPRETLCAQKIYSFPYGWTCRSTVRQLVRGATVLFIRTCICLLILGKSLSSLASVECT